MTEVKDDDQPSVPDTSWFARLTRSVSGFHTESEDRITTSKTILLLLEIWSDDMKRYSAVLLTTS